MDYKYSFQNFNKETMARAVGKSLPISTKHSVELSKAIKFMLVSRAKTYLEEVMSLKQPVKFTRFNQDLGHKKKIGAGRYPVKTAKHFLNILKLAESNAKFKDLNTNDLKIIHICPQKADSRWHYGRQRRRQFKSTHLEIVVEEVVKKSKPKATKVEAKPDVKKEAPKKPIAKAAPVKETTKPEEKPKAEPVKEVKPIEQKPDTEKREKETPKAEKTVEEPKSQSPDQKQEEVKND